MLKLVIFSLTFSFYAFAQTSESAQVNKSTLSTKGSTTGKPEKFEENTEIVDPKLRADSGSRSRYSLKFNLTYLGPTIGDFEAKDQPNPDGTVGSYQTSLGGSFGARYRLSKTSTVGVSSGLKVIHPLHGAERFDTSNPSLTYDWASRINGIQMKNTPGLVIRTIPEFVKIGQVGMLYNNYSLVYEYGTTGFSFGADSAVGVFAYNRRYEPRDKKAPRYSFEFNPNVKYNFTDKLNVIFASSFSLWNPRSKDDQYALLRRSVSQKLGLGYAYTRDIYLNPYVGFYPQYLSWNNATLNMTTIFSVF